MATKAVELARWQSALQSGDIHRIATTARRLADEKSKIDTSFRFTVCDKLWSPVGEVGEDLMIASGTDVRNDCPTGTLQLKGGSKLIEAFMGCRTTMVGVIVETAGLRFPYYVKKHTYKYQDSAWTGTAELKGIWDILNYYTIWPSWFLPIQAQPFSHAVYMWALCTVLENMVSECALRIQSGIWEFVNNALSLNPDIRAWFGTLLQSNGNIFQMLKTPMYVTRTNPLLDTSPLVGRTVRMESCGTVIKDITRAYGVDTRVDLWLPGDEQPDRWANLNQPTYVFSTKDRSQIEGPTKTVLDSALRTVIDLEGSLLGRVMDPILNPKPNPALPNDSFDMFEAQRLGVNFVAPYAIIVAPEDGEDSPIISCEITDHTPEGWQHVIGGRSPKWLNDIMNAFYAWMIDALMILIGITGVPSDLLSGFLNNAFFAFQLIQHYERRAEVGPYHPNVETFTATASAPYNVETLFAFINKLYDTSGYTSAIVRFYASGENAPYKLGRDIFKGGLMSLVYMSRTKMYTDYIEQLMWRITPDERELLVQLGDGKRDEAPLAKHQRFITAAFEAINVLTLAPQSG